MQKWNLNVRNLVLKYAFLSWVKSQKLHNSMKTMTTLNLFFSKQAVPLAYF